MITTVLMGSPVQLTSKVITLCTLNMWFIVYPICVCRPSSSGWVEMKISCSHKNLYSKVHSNITHNGPKVEATQRSM